MNKITIWSAAAASVVGFGGAGIERRYIEYIPSYGTGSTEYYDYSKWTPSSTCVDTWATCSTELQATTGGHQTYYSSYSDYAGSPYYTWDRYHYTNDYEKFVDSSACVDNWSDCVDAAGDWEDWEAQYNSMRPYQSGEWMDYAQTGSYGQYTGVWTHYAGAEYARSGDWTSYVTDFPAVSEEYGATWKDYVDGANENDYGDWRNYAKAAAKYDDYNQYYLNGVYVPGKYTEYGGDWSQYASNYDGDVTINGKQVAVSWTEYVKAANSKEYDYSKDWTGYAKAAAKYDTYDEYYLPGIYVPKAYSYYGPTEDGWRRYVKDYSSQDNDWVGTSYPDGTAWKEYVGAANDKTASNEWRKLASTAAKYDGPGEYCEDYSEFC